MTTNWRFAVNQALLLQQQPRLAEEFRQKPLPDGMTQLIRLISDEGGRRKELAFSLNISDTQLKAAAINYLLTTCMYAGSSDERVLGLNAGSSCQMAKEHHRLLLKWLHPDRNAAENVNAERVNQAWTSIKTTQLSANVSESAKALSTSPTEKSSYGRFPLFLWGLAASAMFLLIFSALPDDTIYVGDVESSQARTREANGQDIVTEVDFEGKLQSIKGALASMTDYATMDGKVREDRSLIMREPYNLSAAIQMKSASEAHAESPKTLLQVLDGRSTIGEANASQVKPLSAKSITDSDESDVTDLTPIVAEKSVPDDWVIGNSRIETAQALLVDFKKRYQLGDIVMFMQMFSDDARNDRGGREALEQDYARLFENSVQRKIRLSNIRWRPEGDILMSESHFSTSVKHQGEFLTATNKGIIEIAFSGEGEQMRIQRISIYK